MKLVNGFVTIKLFCEDNMGQRLQRVTIVLYVDFKRNAYALQANDFLLKILFISNQNTFFVFEPYKYLGMVHESVV